MKSAILIFVGMIFGAAIVGGVAAPPKTSSKSATTVFKPGGKLKGSPTDPVTISANIIVSECCINFVANDETCNGQYVASADSSPIGEPVIVRIPGDATKPITTSTGKILAASVPAAADSSRINHVAAINSLKSTAAQGGLFNK